MIRVIFSLWKGSCASFNKVKFTLNKPKIVNAPEGLNQFFLGRLYIEREPGTCERERERPRFGKIRNLAREREREREKGARFGKIQKKSEPTLPFALKRVGGRSKNNPKWHLFVNCSSISMLRQTFWQPLTRALEFLPFDDSLSSDFLSTLFKLQRFKPLE